jgi:outer membrane protein TolC
MKNDWMLVLPILFTAVQVPADAQEVPAGRSDSLRLGTLQQHALDGDPRQRQFGLLGRQTDLRLSNLAAERLPSFTVEAHGQYQSDVFEAPAGGPSFPVPSKDIYDSRLLIEQPILEPTIGPRRSAERANLAESEARVRTDLFSLRHEVNEAFFTAALLEERTGIIRTTITDLERRHEEAMERVREGVALPSDAAAIQATLTQRQQDYVELGANRRAALARLTQLIGRAISDSAVIVLPDLSAEAAQARREVEDLRARPEYELFARTRERLEREEEIATASQWPELSAFARLGYGRPGLSPINDTFDSYTVAGLKLSWEPWHWGSHGRERQALALQRQIITADESAFANSLTRSIQEDLTAIDRLSTTLAMDDEIILLREQVANETLPRFQEGVVTASEYLDRSTDVLEARLAQATHRVQLSQVHARLLTTLGLEIP